jgi:hypothetical protein
MPSMADTTALMATAITRHEQETAISHGAHDSISHAAISDDASLCKFCDYCVIVDNIYDATSMHNR